MRILLKNIPTEAQAAVMAAVGEYRALHRMSPSIRDLCKLLGMRENGVAGHLRALRRKGYVTWEPGEERTLRLNGVVVVGEVG